MTNEELEKLKKRIIELKNLITESLNKIKKYPCINKNYENLTKHTKELKSIQRILKKELKKVKKK